MHPPIFASEIEGHPLSPPEPSWWRHGAIQHRPQRPATSAAPTARDRSFFATRPFSPAREGRRLGGGSRSFLRRLNRSRFIAGLRHPPGGRSTGGRRRTGLRVSTVARRSHSLLKGRRVCPPEPNRWQDGATRYRHTAPSGLRLRRGRRFGIGHFSPSALFRRRGGRRLGGGSRFLCRRLNRSRFVSRLRLSPSARRPLHTRLLYDYG